MDGPIGEELQVLGDLLLDDRGLDEALEVVLDVAQSHIRGGPDVSMTLRPLDGSGPETRVASAAVARELDQWEYEHGEGPCVRADREHTTCVIDDLAEDDTFPRFGPVALEAGVRSAASFPLIVRGTSIGSLNLFYAEPGACDEAVVDRSARLATTVAPILANFLTHERTVALTGQLEEALDGRAVIERAKGLLMGRLGIAADAAFTMLSTQSQHENRKLREVAADLLADHGANASR